MTVTTTGTETVTATETVTTTDGDSDGSPRGRHTDACGAPCRRKASQHDDLMYLSFRLYDDAALAGGKYIWSMNKK